MAFRMRSHSLDFMAGSMFSVEAVQPGPESRYATTVYWLRDEAAGSAIAVLPDRGGIITEWQIDGQDYFYMDWDRYQDPKNSIRGGNPILFPICGNLPDNAYQLDGTTYPLNQHGFARNMVWTVTGTGTEDAASITLTLSSTPETLVGYPFEFEVSYTYVLKGNTLTIDQQYANKSDRPMPFSAGFHPYFAAADKSQLRFDIPSTESWAKGAETGVPFFNTFDFEVDEIDVAFGDLARSVAIVSDLQRHKRLVMTSGPEFSTLVFWTLKGIDFYCLEPWSAPRNAMNTGKHLLTIAPGAVQSLSVKLAIESM
jgi:galactose mutarotase-like enzyme